MPSIRILSFFCPANIGTLILPLFQAHLGSTCIMDSFASLLAVFQSASNSDAPVGSRVEDAAPNFSDAERQGCSGNTYCVIA